MKVNSGITVITVVKNSACYLEETILSVIENMATSKIDYIIIDGGSTDGTTDVIRKYADHLSYWVSEPDSGIYDAMNKGWAVAADNSFILFLGAGDRIDSLPDNMSCYGQDDVVFGSVRMGEKIVFKARADFLLKLYNSLHHQALLVNKAFHPASPFNCLYRLYADFDFNQRLMKSGAHFVYSPDFIGYARPGGVSDRGCFMESLKVISENYGFLWAAVAISGYCTMKIFPFLKRLRPFQYNKTEDIMIREDMTHLELLIEPNRPALHYWRDVWRYRELFWFLVWRDILVRYKQTVIGVAWSVIRPLVTMIAFTVVFGLLAKLPSEGVPYPLLVFAAMLPWNFFTNALSESSGSLVGNANLLTKIYFPRIIIPISSIIVSLIDFAISLVIMAGIMLWYGYLPDWRIVTMPLFLLLAFLPAAGAGLWFSALNVKYRDFRYVVPFMLQFGLYVSPVGFASSIVPQKWRLLHALNPMVGVIDGFRWALLNGSVELYWPGIVFSSVLSLMLLVSGLWFFRKTERILADVI